MKNKLIALVALSFLGAFHSQISTARAQSPFGNAVNLDGANHYVSVPTAAGSAVNSPLTIEAWVYVRAYADWSRLMDFGNGAGFNNIVCALSSGTSGQPAFYFFNGAATIIGSLVSPSALPLNTWTHLAFTYDGINGSILINGNLATNAPMAAPPSATRTNNFIGRSNFGNPDANTIVDEFRIWSVARSPAQIQASRGAPLVGDEAGLVLYYKFDSASGTVATNSATATGTAYNGTLVNSPAWVLGPTPPSSLVTNTSDAGAGSLREAINTTPPGGFIYFATNLSGQTISLTSGQLVVTKNLTIDASALAGVLTVDGSHNSRILLITNNTAVVLKSLNLANGNTDLVGGGRYFGGGIYNSTNCTLTLTRCALYSNYARNPQGGQSRIPFGGAGIYNAGTLTLNQSTLFTNSAAGFTSQFATGNAGGGGIYNVGTLTLNQSTLSGNSASGGNGVFQFGPFDGASGSGGGIYNVGTLTLNQSTLSSNSASGGNASYGGVLCDPDCFCWGAGSGGSGSGGGIYNVGTLTLNQNTLAGNSAYLGRRVACPLSLDGTALGGGIYNTAANVTVRNCLIAMNLGGGGPDLSGSFISHGHNLVGATNGCAGIIGGVNGDLAGTTNAPLNPLLSPLSNHGGPTLTLAVLLGSPAIDAGDDSLTNTVATDQRGPGFPRRFLQHVDIGAYEFGSANSAPTIASLNAGSVALAPLPSLVGDLSVGASVNPNAPDYPTIAWVQYGLSTGYGLTTTPLRPRVGLSYVPLTQPLTDLASGQTWHYRWVATNFFGTALSPDQTVNVGTPGGGGGLAGDLNGDGVVSQSELDTVYGNYVTNSPWLYMTNIAGVGGTNVSFALDNSVLGAYSIQYSTNLVNWYYLGAATPRYLFTDTNAPALPKRYYRLSYP